MTVPVLGDIQSWGRTQIRGEEASPVGGAQDSPGGSETFQAGGVGGSKVQARWDARPSAAPSRQATVVRGTAIIIICLLKRSVQKS